MQSWERDLTRWQQAGVLDAASVERIRAFETRGVRPERSSWQVRLALILGSVLLCAGVLLLVASHWDQISPWERVMAALGLLACLHGGAALATERFPAMATALHAAGTAGAGAAIATIGQVFNMQEHWPGAVLLWALCAGAGWWLLRDEVQQVWCLLLLPAWLISEWSYRAEPYREAGVYLARMVAVLAAAYLVSLLHSRKRVVRGMLFGLAGLALPVCVGVLSDGWGRWVYQPRPALPWGLRFASFAFIGLLLATAFVWERRSAVPVALVTVMVMLLPWLQARVSMQNEFARQAWVTDEPSLLAYALVAAVAGFLAWWGVRERSRALVNYGIAVFAIAVAWFYFSNLMDKLGRSLGLIGLGVLFLLGGWLLERLRRRLISEVQGQPGGEMAS